ncbi:MAG: PepSY domain-containing protein [Pseudomonadales bacterium]
MNMRKTIIATTIATLGFGAANALLADERETAGSTAKITIEQAMKIAATEPGAQVIAADTKHFKQQPAYLIMTESNNTVSETLISGLDGTVLGSITIEAADEETLEYLEENAFEHDLDDEYSDHDDDDHDEDRGKHA